MQRHEKKCKEIWEMKEIQKILEQVEQGKITTDDAVKLIRYVVIELHEKELLDFAFALREKS